MEILFVIQDCRINARCKNAAIANSSKLMSKSFPAPYLNLHAKYSHMTNMPLGCTSPDSHIYCISVRTRSPRTRCEVSELANEVWSNVTLCGYVTRHQHHY